MRLFLLKLFFTNVPIEVCRGLTSVWREVASLEDGSESRWPLRDVLLLEYLSSNYLAYLLWVFCCALVLDFFEETLGRFSVEAIFDYFLDDLRIFLAATILSRSGALISSRSMRKVMQSAASKSGSQFERSSLVVCGPSSSSQSFASSMMRLVMELTAPLAAFRSWLAKSLGEMGPTLSDFFEVFYFLETFFFKLTSRNGEIFKVLDELENSAKVRFCYNLASVRNRAAFRIDAGILLLLLMVSR